MKSLSKLNISINKKTPIDYILEELKYNDIDEMIIALYSVGIKPFYILDKNKDKIKNLTIYYSGYLKRMRKEVFVKLKLMSDTNGWNMIEVDSHMKLILMKSNENYTTINSTSNFSSNSKIESTRVFKNKSVYLKIKEILKCQEVIRT